MRILACSRFMTNKKRLRRLVEPILGPEAPRQCRRDSRLAFFAVAENFARPLCELGHIRQRRIGLPLSCRTWCGFSLDLAPVANGGPLLQGPPGRLSRAKLRALPRLSRRWHFALGVGQSEDLQ
jgi:hypothetical protein